MKKKWQKAQHGKPEFCVEQKKIETWFEKKMKKSRRWWLQAVGASNEDGSRLTLASFSSSYANEMRLDGWSEDDFDQPHTGDGSLLDGQSKPPATESALRVILRLVAGIKKKRKRKTNKKKVEARKEEKRGEKRRQEKRIVSPFYGWAYRLIDGLRFSSDDGRFVSHSLRLLLLVGALIFLFVTSTRVENSGSFSAANYLSRLSRLTFLSRPTMPDISAISGISGIWPASERGGRTAKNTSPHLHTKKTNAVSLAAAVSPFIGRPSSRVPLMEATSLTDRRYPARETEIMEETQQQQQQQHHHHRWPNVGNLATFNQIQ